MGLVCSTVITLMRGLEVSRLGLALLRNARCHPPHRDPRSKLAAKWEIKLANSRRTDLDALDGIVESTMGSMGRLLAAAALACSIAPSTQSGPAPLASICEEIAGSHALSAVLGHQVRRLPCLLHHLTHLVLQYACTASLPQPLNDIGLWFTVVWPTVVSCVSSAMSPTRYSRVPVSEW
jgi:hypothetical protein